MTRMVKMLVGCVLATAIAVTVGCSTSSVSKRHLRPVVLIGFMWHTAPE